MTICHPHQTRVPRFVRKVLDAHTQHVENPIESLDRFRSNAAWVLLGEPGAGKTTAFEMESEAIGGEYLRLDEFTHLDIESNWHGKTLFLDSLDEVRAGTGGDSLLLRVRRQLKRLGNPSFRIACRAVDWYGSTDRVELESASPNNQITVLLLEPLSDENILTLLRKNYSIDDPQAFVVEAEKRGVAALLDNPQTLELLVKAVVGGGRWPKTRDETYQLACEQLAIEANKRHRDKKRTTLFPIEKVLDAAGQLYAVLLFSDKTGLALDPASANERFPDLADYGSSNTAATSQAIGSNLFRPEGEERVVPRHRSIAEYLAARWLGRRIDQEGLPLRRVLNLLLGADGGVVAGLRGLFGWLALHCLSARLCLINADPLTVIVYGDVKPMPVADKRRILAGLRREAERYTAFRRDVLMAHPFGALADVELRDDFLSILQATERDEPNQSFADCVLTILTHGEAQPEFALILLDIVRDDTRWLAVRKDALKAWLKLSINPQEALNLLDDVTEGRVTDHDDELAGTLLRHLYPMHLDAKMLLRYLHEPKKSELLGSYVVFWEHQLPQEILLEHRPILVDGLVDHPTLRSCDPSENHLNQMANTLLVHGIEVHGDHITDDRLFAWLGIGSDKYGYFQRLRTEHQTIANWLSARPERYKSLLALCFKQCEQHEHPVHCIYGQLNRLHNAIPPQDIGLWHLEHVDQTINDELAKMHLAQAVLTLSEGRGSFGLSLDRLEAWGTAHPEWKHWLDCLLTCEIPDGRTREVAKIKIQKKKRSVLSLIFLDGHHSSGKANKGLSVAS